MPFNGAGMFVRLRNWVADATAGIKIRADYHDIEDDNFAEGISNCIAKDGQTTVMNNIPFNSKRITTLADPVNPQDAATKAYADTKLPLAGGTISGNLTITGTLGAGLTSTSGYRCRSGTAGSFGGNYFNFNWDGSFHQIWVDGSNTGQMCTIAYMEQRASAWAHAIADPKVNRAGDTWTGNMVTAAGGNIGSASGMNSLWVAGGAGDWAAMTFYSPGAFGGNFGMHPNGDFYCGGWSYGAGMAYKFWTTRNLNPIQDGRLVFAGQYLGGAGNTGIPQGMQEPFGGGVVTGVHGGASGGTYAGVCVGAKWRYMQLLTPGGWYTVANVG